MVDFSKYGLSAARILLPDPTISYEAWSVVACDQFTTQPEYWERADELVGDRPSTLRMIYPEAYFKSGPAGITQIHQAMRKYLPDVLTRVIDGFVLVERETTAGARLGLVAAIDLEAYDYTPQAATLIRATEGTVVDRLPPRVAIRRGADVEAPHALLLADDPDARLIEPLYARRDTLQKVYDFDLMLDGGHIRGWAIEDERDFLAIQDALEALSRDADGFLFAVGDGNHSIAAAKAYWDERKKQCGAETLARDPARYALVEICNLRSDAIRFEPIHRALFDVNEAELAHDFMLFLRRRGMGLVQALPERAELYMLEEPLKIVNMLNPLPLTYLQPFLDEYLATHPDASIDYIHGADALCRLDACRIRLMPFDKARLFEAVRKSGSLPRKTFSMGEARDKRYYLECRKLV